MTTQHNLYTINNDLPTKVSPTAEGAGRDVTYQNANASGYIYLGSEGVTSTNYGYRIMPNHAISFELEEQDELYAIASAPNMKLAYISINLENKN